MRTLLAALLVLLTIGWAGSAEAGEECARFEACCIRLNGNVPQCSTDAYTEAQCAESNRFYASQCGPGPRMPASGGVGPECTRFAACCTSLYGNTPQCDPSSYSEAQCAQANAANAGQCASVAPAAPVQLHPCEEFRQCCVAMYGAQAPQCDVSAYTERQCTQANAANAEQCAVRAPAPDPGTPPPVATPAGPECTRFQACCRSMYGDVPQCNPSTYSEEQCAAANAANAGQCAGVVVPMGPGPECQRFQQCCVSMYGAVPQCDVSPYSEEQCAAANAANAGACQ